jgi:hypothetical protein
MKSGTRSLIIGGVNMFNIKLVRIYFLFLASAWFQPVFADSSSFLNLNTSDILAIGKNILSTLEDAEDNSNEAGSDYSRSAFGHGWADFDGDCQNSRHETLIAQSSSQVTYKTNRQCRVVSGTWESVFSNKPLYQSSKIDIDHVVPLKWAWERGASVWSKTKRVSFANDPLNLLAVEARLNRQKGAKGPQNWLPPTNKCQYINLFSKITDEYKLVYAFDEKREIKKLQKRHCG